MLCLYSIEKLINYKKSYIANYYSLSFLKKSLQYTLLLLLKLKENDVKATFRKSFCRRRCLKEIVSLKKCKMFCI